MALDGIKITRGDLWGYSKPDPVLGYVPEENSISINGIWQTNNVGARLRNDTSRSIPHGKKRILVFGESYAAGSRVSNEQVWSNIINRSNTDYELINFAVDGYSMGQSYLRYKSIISKLQYDAVIIVFVPRADLWRDINMVRNLGKPGWGRFDIIMPRFKINNERLILVNRPPKLEYLIYKGDYEKYYESIREYIENDSFYFKYYLESPKFFKKSIIFKLITGYIYEIKKNSIHNKIKKLNLDSEAMHLSKKIFLNMYLDNKRNNKDFMLVFLPKTSDLKKFLNSNTYLTDWEKMVAYICSNKIRCLDLSKSMLDVDNEYLDRGYDGSHYDPKANQMIAAFILQEIRNWIK